MGFFYACGSIHAQCQMFYQIMAYEQITLSGDPNLCLPVEIPLSDGNEISKDMVIAAAIHDLVKIYHICRALTRIYRHHVLRVYRIHPAYQNSVTLASIIMFSYHPVISNMQWNLLHVFFQEFIA